MKTDINIAQAATLKPIQEIAETIGLSEDSLELMEIQSENRFSNASIPRSEARR